MREVILVQEGKLRHTALVEDGEVCEYFVCSGESSSSLAGTIWKGRVERIVPGMGAAFISLGLERNGFLPLREAPGFTGQVHQAAPLQTGQEVLVQVKKDPVGEKGAFLTRDITFPGTFVILLPLDGFVGVSRRVQDESQREELLALGRELRPAGAGLVMRSNALNARPEEILEEITALSQAWQAVLKAYPEKNAPRMLYENLDPFGELLRDYPPGEISRIVTNIRDLSVSGIPVDCRTNEDLLAVFGITGQVDKALSRKIWLKSGGYLIIDLCEAMSVIDVNTGKFTGRKLPEETVFTLNLEACKETARQIRLRNLGGIVIIDFIDMQEEQHRAAVTEALKHELAKDRVKTVVHGFTSLGLMECTRKKARKPLHLVLSDPCPRCGGNGRVRTEYKEEGETTADG